MSQRSIYLTAGDSDLRKKAAAALKHEGYRVSVFKSVKELLSSAVDGIPPQLIIMDAAAGGFEACARIQALSDLPIVLFVGEEDAVDAWPESAKPREGTVAKPLDAAVLVQHVREVFRRMDEREKAERRDDRVMAFADVQIDPKRQKASSWYGDLTLSPNEYGVLFCLMSHLNRPVGRGELLDRIWGSEKAGETRVVDDTVKRLRRKITRTRLVVETVWGYGFRLRARL